MILFVLGFMCCWIIFAVLQLFAETHDWFFDDWYLCLTTAPILIPVFIVKLLFVLICHPWRNIAYPVSRSVFNADVTHRNLKVLHIWRFKICYDKRAKFINKLFFVRVKKGT